MRFWTLYGHLGRSVLNTLHEGDRIAAGDEFATLGALHENGGWPPHLHLQLITDVGAYRGDFPGVAAPSERAGWLTRCPDPSPLLRFPEAPPLTPR